MPSYTIFYIFAFIIFILNFNYYKKCERPIASSIYGGISGLLFLIVASFILKYLGYSLLINYTTICISLLFGIPGVTLMTILLFI